MPSSAPASRSGPVESPCIRVCRLNPEGACTGCGRTLDEISDWSLASEAERARICELAAQRLRSVDNSR
ncbi:MAG: DUF1289 domain-containing protein [Fimbriimonadaceae bacterium]